MLNIAVLGSGRGSNFQAIMEAIAGGKITNARIRVVISNNSDAGILHVARAHSIPAIHLSQAQFMSEQAFVEELLDTLHEHGVDFIVLAGYMKRLHPRVIQVYRHRIVNIHPALLPKFGGKGMYGKHVHQAVIAAGEPVSGATVHFVDEEYDHGDIVLQKTVALVIGETPESLAEKVLKIEHELYPKAIQMIAEGQFRVRQAAPTFK